jgi:tetratricopeptide (TPR) repeat protein
MDIGQIENKLERRPHSPLFARLADEYIKIGKFTEAKDLCCSGLQRYPSYSIVHIVLARCYYAEKNYPAALEEAYNALAIYPDSQVVKDLIQKSLYGLNPPEPEPEVPVESIGPEAQGPEAEEEVIQEPLASGGDDEQAEEPGTEEIPALPNEEPAGEMIVENIPPPVESITASPVEEIHEAIPVATDSQPAEIEAAADVQPVVEDRVEESTQPFWTVSSDPVNVETVQSPEAKLEPHAEIVEQTETINEEAAERPVEPETEVIAPKAEQQIQQEETVNKFEEPEAPQVLQQSETVEEDIEEPTDGRIISQTLAEIYVRQGVYDEAILTYKLLKRRRPELAAKYDERIKELETKLPAKSE